MKTFQTLEVLSNTQLAPGVYRLELLYPEGRGPEEIRPGQFVGVYCRDGARLLPRPISICEWDTITAGTKTLTCLDLVYRVVGAGTAEFARLKREDEVQVLGILGNGYDLSLLTGKRVLLIGGGIGAPPLLGLARELWRANQTMTSQTADSDIRKTADSDANQAANFIANRTVGSAVNCTADSIVTHTAEPAVRFHDVTAPTITAVLGYRDSNLFLKEDFEKYASVVIATDDGSAGFRGNVVDAIRAMNSRKPGTGIEKESPGNLVTRKETDSPEDPGTGKKTDSSEDPGTGKETDTPERPTTGEDCYFPYDVICSCGPLPMLRAVKALAQEKHVPCYISMEERMACGVGACLGCVTQTQEIDAHFQVRSTRICTEGPVFDAETIVL